MKVLLFIAALAVSVSLSAQMTGSSKAIKANVGLGSGMIPVSVSYEQGVYSFSNGSFITAGGYVGYGASSEDFVDGGKFKYNNIYVAAMGNYYFKPIVDKLDLYAGLRLGYDIASAETVWDNPEAEEYYGDKYSASAGGFIYTAHAGANYWLSDSFAINAELGYGVSFLSVGVSYKF